MKLDITKFNWKEIFNNNDGKTSGSGVAGVFLIAVSIATIINANVMIWMHPTAAIQLIEQIVTIIIFASALLGVRKIIDKKVIDPSTFI